MAGRWLAVPVKDRSGRHLGWSVYSLPIGPRSRVGGRFRGPLAKQRAEARARKLCEGR
jgi:hypothetical protein